MMTSELDNGATKCVVVPSGRDYERCLDALESEFNITTPDFGDRKLTAETDDMMYKKVKGKDVPVYLWSGRANLGVVGSDICEEKIPEGSNLQFKTASQAMCSFNILFPVDTADQLRERLENLKEPPVEVVTSYPNFFRKCVRRALAEGRVLNVKLLDFTPSGSVEALPGWITEAAADLVESGMTATANNLEEGLKLANVYPALVWRDLSKPLRPLSQNVFGVDTTLDERVQEVQDRSLTSYTISRLRDPNKALKDFGEEVAEYLEAAIRNRETAVDELADLIFAGLVLSRANGGSVRLADAVQLLEDRNMATSLKKGT